MAGAVKDTYGHYNAAYRHMEQAMVDRIDRLPVDMAKLLCECNGLVANRDTLIAAATSQRKFQLILYNLMPALSAQDHGFDEDLLVMLRNAEACVIESHFAVKKIVGYAVENPYATIISQMLISMFDVHRRLGGATNFNGSSEYKRELNTGLCPSKR